MRRAEIRLAIHRLTPKTTNYLPKDAEGYGSYKSDSSPELYMRFIFAAEDGEDDLPDT